jgi:uncharacterized membrane protein YeaQ/YmgE (transglycosylase-associated protein family)
MLEILFLIWFCKKLASIARDKNRPGSWGAVGAIGWIGGEIGGAVLGASTSNAQGMDLYGYAIMGAIVGALAAWLIVRNLSEVPLDTGLPQARIV